MQQSRRAMQLSGCLLAVGFLTFFVAVEGAQGQAGGSLVVRVRAGGQDADATIKVLTPTAEPTEVAKGRPGRPIAVPNGTYDLEITCTDLLDQPTQELRGVAVSGGQTVEREATFPSGTVTLHVKRAGRPLKNQALILTKVGGGEVAGRAKTGEPFKISPGQYEAEVIVGTGRQKTSHKITGVQVYDGATRNIPVDL